MIVAAAIICHGRTFSAGWIWDDDFYVWNNPTLRSLAGLRDIWLRPKATPQYYPLVHTSYWFEYRLWGDAPAGYHVVNVLLHAAGSVLLWRLLAALGVPGAWLSGLLFAIHPVEVESVAWVTERKNTLSMLLALVSLSAWVRFRFPGGAGGPGTAAVRAGWTGYGLSLIAFTGALLAKTVTVTLVGLLPLLTWWKTGRLGGRDILTVIPFLVVGLPLALGTVLLEKYHVGARGAEWSLQGPERVLVAGRAIWFYAGKICWPDPLIFFYRRWQPDAASLWQWAFPASAAAVLVLLLAVRGRIGRGPFTVAAAFCGCLFPALGFFDVYPFRFSFVADHFQYHASAVLLAGIAAGGAWAATRRPAWRGPIAAFGACACLALAAQTIRQSGVYRDLQTLGRDTLEKNPSAWAMRDILGPYLMTIGRAAEAEEVYRPVLDGSAPPPPWPHDQAKLHYNRARAVEAQGRLAEAEAGYRRAILLDSLYPKPRNNLAKMLADTGRRDEAVQVYEALLALPLTAAGESRYAFNLGTVLAELSRWPEAEMAFERAFDRNPRSAETAEWLGIVAVNRKNPGAARDWFLRAVSLAPEGPVRNRSLAHLRGIGAAARRP
jgi:tetratricopeptide (TPR) repeat protein